MYFINQAYHFNHPPFCQHIIFLALHFLSHLDHSLIAFTILALYRLLDTPTSESNPPWPKETNIAVDKMPRRQNVTVTKWSGAKFVGKHRIDCVVTKPFSFPPGTKRESFITWLTINIVLFTTIYFLRPNKLECLCLVGFSSLVYCLWARPSGAYPRVEHLKGGPLS